MFAYDQWANNLLIEAITQNNVIDDRVLSLISHVIWAKTVWMKRVKNDDVGAHTPFSIIPMDELKIQSAQAHTDYTSFITNISDFITVVNYKNSRGDAWNSTLEDILTHVANHGTHHRAQIASRLKELGLNPPVIDYIAYSRLGN